MLPRPHPSSRRRSAYGPQLCALVAALLLLLSLFVLHSRLSSSSLFPRPSSDPVLLDDDDDRGSDRDRDPSPDPLDDRIDELDVLDEDAADRSRRRLPDDGAHDAGSDDSDISLSPPSAIFWDHVLGVARRPFGSRRDGDDAWLREDDEIRQPDRIGIAFGSDDEPVDEEVQAKLGSIRRIEEALLLKVGAAGGASSLRLGWERWLEAKADFLRKDRMLRSNLELLNPKNHPLLQDPDGPWLTALTRGDRLVQRVLMNEMEKTQFVEDRSVDAKVAERRSLHSDVAEEEKKKMALKEEKKKGEEKVKDVDHSRQWGYFPGLDPHLGFSEFMDQFLRDSRCSMKVFMVWNSPPWTYGVRHQRGLESLLQHHKDACVVLLSETMELDFFRDFVKDGFRVAVAMPNLDELLEDTPTHVFASVWFEWRKTRHYPIHYSELIRFAVLYKYGGIYLDSDVIVLNHLQSLQNSVGIKEQVAGNSTFSGAVMAFSKHSPFLMECLKEFHSTYDDTLLKWNGADLMTRVINRLSSNGLLGIKIEPPSAFYPISSTNITRYFAEPVDEFERGQHEALFMRMVKESITFHLWNDITSALVPEPSSLVERLLNHHCLHCLDVL